MHNRSGNIPAWTLAPAVLAACLMGGCSWFIRPLHYDSPASPGSAASAGTAGTAGGAGSAGSSASAEPSPAWAPTPQAGAGLEVGVRSLQLTYALPGRTAAPGLISWQQIDITDESGRVCPIRNVHLGRNPEGWWTSISFGFEPGSRKIAARLVLNIDNIDYPLAATLTRTTATRWRVDYGVLPTEK